MEPSIDDVTAAVPAWRGRQIVTSPIVGGLTNRNFRVEVDGVPYFVRIPSAGTDLLAVDRANELHNTQAAAQTGVGPPVLASLPQWDVIVLKWIAGRTMSNAAFQRPGQPERIAEALRRLHEIGRAHV